MPDQKCSHEKFVVGRDFSCIDFRFIYICTECGAEQLTPFDEPKNAAECNPLDNKNQKKQGKAKAK